MSLQETFKNYLSGSMVMQLAQVKEKAIPTFPRVPQIDGGNSNPSYDLTIAEFSKAPGYESIARHLQNKVKICSCGKPNAFTLKYCNSCGTSLASLEIKFVWNIFMGFLFGLKDCKVSLRFQSEKYLAFDDMLQLSVCHLCVIPTSVYIPDWRYLLKHPTEGLTILKDMYDTCWNIFVKNFWGNEDWRKKMINCTNSDGTELTLDQLKTHVIAGLNLPPSQYQLHLQFMIPPFVPFQHCQLINGVHFTYKRFFPIEYVLKILELKEPKAVSENTTIEEILNFYSSVDPTIDYDTIHEKSYKKYFQSHAALGNWRTEDFESVIVNGKEIVSLDGTQKSEVNNDKVKKMQADDKSLLQNYGRVNGGADKEIKTSYYAFKKAPSDVNFDYVSEEDQYKYNGICANFG